MSPFDSSPHARLSTLLVVVGSLTLLHAKSFLPSHQSAGGSDDGGLTLIESGHVAAGMYTETAMLAPTAFLDDSGAMINTLVDAPTAVTGMDRFAPISTRASAEVGAATSVLGTGALAGGGSYAASQLTGGGGSGYGSAGFQANGSRGGVGGGGSGGSSRAGIGGGSGGSSDAAVSADRNQGKSDSSFSGNSGRSVNSARLAAADSPADAAATLEGGSAFDGGALGATDFGNGVVPGAASLLAASDLTHSVQIAGAAAAQAADANATDLLVAAPLAAEVSDTAGTLGLLAVGLGMLAAYGRRLRARTAPAG